MTGIWLSILIEVDVGQLDTKTTFSGLTGGVGYLSVIAVCDWNSNSGNVLSPTRRQRVNTCNAPASGRPGPLTLKCRM